MKKIMYSTYVMLAMLVFTVACQEESLELKEAPAPEEATFTFTPTTANKNIISFSSTTPAFLKHWDFGNGTSGEGDVALGTFPVQGTYTVTLTAYTAGGSISSTQTIVIAETDPTLLDIPVYNLLTGGNSKPNGKTWVIDAAVKGHFGVGPATALTPEYYAAGANEKAGSGLYNDKYTFKISAFSYIFDTGGDVYMNGSQISNFPGAAPSPAGDFTAPYVGPPNLKWTITEDEAKNQFITISPGGFIGYYTGVSKYQILKLEENEMFLKYMDAASADLAWFIRLVPEGYVAPVVELPYKIENINTNFDGTGVIDFANDSQGSIATYDNPAPVPINTSAKVGKYVKGNGNGGEYANVQINPGYRMDISTRNKFKLKIFVPGYNDYTTTGAESWQSYQTLQKQVSVKLQNSLLGGNAYTTQAEVIKAALPVDQWVELTFDFSGSAARKDFDRIVIQIGGEANFTGGIFFIDDFELLP